MHAIFTYVKEHNREMKKWDPIEMKPPKDHLKVIQGIRIRIQ
jgi:hypothetical protein